MKYSCSCSTHLSCIEQQIQLLWPVLKILAVLGLLECWKNGCIDPSCSVRMSVHAEGSELSIEELLHDKATKYSTATSRKCLLYLENVERYNIVK